MITIIFRNHNNNYYIIYSYNAFFLIFFVAIALPYVLDWILLELPVCWPSFDN
jgi:hypothetical protein